MKKKFKLGIIGAGFMATAMVKGAISANTVTANQILVCDLSETALNNISKFGVSVTPDSKYLADNCEFVLFAVKPQNVDEVLSNIKGFSCSKFISIMAGVKKNKIKSTFPNALVARCMPNTPCSIGCGAVGLDVSDYTDEQDVQFITKLLSSVAEVVILDEEFLNAVTGISGSSPAYFYLFLKGVIDAGVKFGLNYEDAKKLATSTMIGAGKMIMANPDKSIDDLISAVCSKGGTTIEAVKVFNDKNLNGITESAVTACVKRSIELENL